MKQVVKKVLPMLALLVLVGAGCSNVRPDTSSTSPAESTENRMAATDCKTDETCANKVWTDCVTGGSFTFVEDGVSLANVTMGGKLGEKCMFDWSYTDEYLATGGPAGEMLKGKSMTCSVNATEGTAMSGFGMFVEGQMTAGFGGCGGTLKEVLNTPPEAVLQD